MESDRTEKTKLIEENISSISDDNHQHRLIDKLWPYLVLSSCMLSYIAAAGFNYGISGAITQALSLRFGVSISEASWTTSVHTAVFFMSAPLTGVLSRLISIRKLQLMGALISTIGVGFCYISTELWHVVLLFGTVAGFGLACVRSASIAIPVYYFEKDKLNLASGATMLGFCFGFFLYPVPTTFLFTTYGFNTAMLMLTPIMLVHLCGVAVFSQKGSKLSQDERPESKPLTQSMKSMLRDKNMRVFLGCGFFRKFGITSFFSLINDYMVKRKDLTPKDAATGPTFTGVFSVLGILLVLFTTAKFKYTKLIPHGVTTITYAGCMLATTFVHKNVHYWSIMAVLGLAYGAQVANVVAVAHEFVGSQDMALAFAFELSMQGLGSLLVGPIAGFLQTKGGNLGLYLCSLSCFIAGLLIIILLALRSQCIPKSQSDAQEVITNNQDGITNTSQHSDTTQNHNKSIE